MELNHREN